MLMIKASDFVRTSLRCLCSVGFKEPRLQLVEGLVLFEPKMGGFWDGGLMNMGWFLSYETRM